MSTSAPSRQSTKTPEEVQISTPDGKQRWRFSDSSVLPPLQLDIQVGYKIGFYPGPYVDLGAQGDILSETASIWDVISSIQPIITAQPQVSPGQTPPPVINDARGASLTNGEIGGVGMSATKIVSFSGLVGRSCVGWG